MPEDITELEALAEGKALPATLLTATFLEGTPGPRDDEGCAGRLLRVPGLSLGRLLLLLLLLLILLLPALLMPESVSVKAAGAVYEAPVDEGGGHGR